MQRVSPHSIICFLDSTQPLVFQNKTKNVSENVSILRHQIKRWGGTYTSDRRIYILSRPQTGRLQDRKLPHKINTSGAFTVLISLHLKFSNIHKNNTEDASTCNVPFQILNNTSHTFSLYLSSGFTFDQIFPLFFAWQIFSTYIGKPFFCLSPYLTENSLPQCQSCYFFRF